MKKKFNFTNLFNILSTILVVCFLVKTIIDYTQYSSTLNSTPFYVWILFNALYFIVPSIILFIVGIVIKKRTNN